MTSFLDRLGPADLEGFSSLGRARRLPSRSVLFLEGDDAHSVHLIRSGVVKLSANVGGRDIVLDLVGRGDIVGELSVIDGRQRSATATALVPVEVTTIPAHALLDHLAVRPATSMAMMRHIAWRLRSASQRQVEYGALDGVGRVCRRLVEMMDRFGRVVEGSVVVESLLTQSEIGAWAGLSREAVVKSLHSLRRLGWLRTDARSIIVDDPCAVRRRASAAD